MDEALFWSLIARLDWDQAGDDEAVLEPLVAALARLGELDIYRFEDLLAEKLHALDGEAHARQIGVDGYDSGDGLSPDLFLHARCCAVARGRDLFLRVLFDPRQMPKDCAFATLLHASARAYERKTGLGYEHAPEVSIETGSNPSGWARAGRRR